LCAWALAAEAAWRPPRRPVTFIAPRTGSIAQSYPLIREQRMPSSNSKNPSRRLVLGALAGLPVVSVNMAASVRTATAQAALPTGGGFSFAAVGDTRPMMYLPLKEGQPDLSKFFVEMFGLVMPEKVAEAVVAKDVKMIFDPVTKGPDQGSHAVRIQDGSDDPDGR
jgi:hypothetical protein